ncbi:ATP-binding protein [Nocardiopsis sp. TSRI0078]|uniref:GTP-binding protein n=1 Tax=unclassified Nocardiopsis TaxID=2649073 RepID=UPI00093F5616|nr:ATP/GTP-binding protein [Nocardiopsis sp. TSRI0078]OKI17123.1 ATP-binding protein [Nocardiopsis sp. TSRI0078]
MHSTTSESPAPEPPSAPGPAEPPSGAAGPAPGDAHSPLPATAEQALKIAVVGGFGAGKTTLVRSVSEIRPLSTEETMTRAGDGIDVTDGVEAKHATTVAFDFGRITLDATSVLYVFGAPGQERFWFLWDRLFSGALGAVVLVDTRRLEDSFYAIDRLEAQGTPFVVAHNDFGDTEHTLDQVRAALDLDPAVPLVRCDARVRASAKQVLIALVRHVRSLVGGGAR